MLAGSEPESCQRRRPRRAGPRQGPRGAGREGHHDACPRAAGRRGTGPPGVPLTLGVHTGRPGPAPPRLAAIGTDLMLLAAWQRANARWCWLPATCRILNRQEARLRLCRI